LSKIRTGESPQGYFFTPFHPQLKGEKLMPPPTPTPRKSEIFFLVVIIVISVLGNWLLPVKTPDRVTFLWLGNMVLLLLFATLAGHIITGLWRGVLIDSSNKISLSRFQMLIWTILLLSSFLTAAVINLHSGHVEPLSIALHQDLWGLLGISTASLVASPLIKTNKKNEPKPTKAEERIEKLAENHGVPASRVHAVGVLAVNDDPKDASFADMFKGEEIDNFTYLDLGKIQMFYFTLLLWFVYAAALLVMLKSGIKPGAAKISAFPDLDSGMIALLGISHAAYIANKAIPHTQQSNN
jgi:hypothetical protein